jgi:plastocyanin
MQRFRVSVAAALALAASAFVFLPCHGALARGAAEGPAPATTLGGTTHQVGISGFTYTPDDLTIQVGDSVAFAASGMHPLRSDDGLFSCDAACTQTFDAPGEYRYYCDNHGGAGGQGMSGIVRVVGGTTHQVGISGFTYTPATLIIAPGDSVAFAASGMHPLRSDDSLFSCDANCTVAFPDVGEYRYYCDNHGGPGGQGMSGIILVQAATAPALELSATSLVAEAAAGDSTVRTFDIGNGGSAPLDWSADSSTADCISPVAVPWLSVDPAIGTVAPAAQSTVEAIFDATALDPGTYSANLCVHSNDPAHNPATLPVEFTVTAAELIFQNGFDGPPQ